MQSSSSTTGTATQEQQLRAQLELLKNPDADPASATPDLQARDFRKGHASYASPPPLSNGYDHHHHSPSSQDAARSLASKPDADSHIHPDLRAAAAAAAAAAASHAEAPVADMLPIAPPPGHSPGASGPSAGLVAQQPLSGGEDGAGNGRKAKRELAQSKRAAQNRAAQRAFRQRKETYIKQLEQEVRDYREMEKNYKGMQSESYALREYVVTLQSRLLDAVGEFPAPPPNVNLGPPAPTEPPMNNQETASHSLNAGTPLEAVAQAVAGLAAQEQMNDRHQYTHQPLGSEQSTQDTRTADEINRHLQSSEEVKPPVV